MGGHSIEPFRRRDTAAERLPPTGQGVCSYCGTALVSAFYFCLGCGAPYKNIESVLSRPVPRAMTEGIAIARLAPRVWPLFWTYVIVVVSTSVLAFVLFQNKPLSLYFVSAALTITTIVYATIHRRALLVQLRRIGFDSGWAWLALLGLAPLLAINYGWHESLFRLLPQTHRSEMESFYRALPGGVMVVVMCILPAITEEIAFRGLVQHWLTVAIGPWRALLLASGLFTILHFSIISAPYLFLAGMLMGWARLKTGSLYPSMLIHLLHNFLVIEFLWPGG